MNCKPLLYLHQELGAVASFFVILIVWFFCTYIISSKYQFFDTITKVAIPASIASLEFYAKYQYFANIELPLKSLDLASNLLTANLILFAHSSLLWQIHTSCASYLSTLYNFTFVKMFEPEMPIHRKRTVSVTYAAKLFRSRLCIFEKK